MSNDKVQSIMALVRKYVAACLSAGGTESPSSIAAALESAIREAIAAPGVAQAREVIELCQKALAEELSAWDIEPPLHHVKEAHDACAKWLAAPSPTTEEHIQLHDPVTIKGGPAE